MPFEATDVHVFLDAIGGAGVEVVILGGWGVDALVGEQSRPHEDLDLWADVNDDATIRAAAAGVGYSEVPGGRRHNYVLADEHGREIDVHLVSWRPDGSAVYETASGEDFVMTADTFVTGRIGGREVRCVSALQQMLDHSEGYEQTATDHADMQLLHDRLGASYLPPFGDA